MKIWAPTGNQIQLNEELEKRVWNHRFWIDYYNQTDPEKRTEMFENWQDPQPHRWKFREGIHPNIYDDVYGEEK